MTAVPLSGILPAVVTPLDERGVFMEAALREAVRAALRGGRRRAVRLRADGRGTAATTRTAQAGGGGGGADDAEGPHGDGAHRRAVDVDCRGAGASCRIGRGASGEQPASGEDSYTMDEVRAYYSAIASSVSIPVLVYYFPAFAANPKSLSDLISLCEIPNVAGLKFTSTDLYTLGELKRQGAVIFNGYDEILVAGLLMGADGGIGTFYNVIPEWFVELYRSARSGRLGTCATCAVANQRDHHDRSALSGALGGERDVALARHGLRGGCRATTAVERGGSLNAAGSVGSVTAESGVVALFLVGQAGQFGRRKGCSAISFQQGAGSRIVLRLPHRHAGHGFNPGNKVLPQFWAVKDTADRARQRIPLPFRPRAAGRPPRFRPTAAPHR